MANDEGARREERPSLRPDRRFQNLAVILSLIAWAAPPAVAWGNQAHQLVNGLAVENLPEPLRSYFRASKNYLVEHASDPDYLAHDDPTERSHHYTDADADDRDPFPRLKKQFVDERRGPTPSQLRNGDSIWQIETFALRLADDLRRRQWQQAEHDAVFAAHYACDLTQPLHTIVNYDGQLTRQGGVHARFETDLVKAVAGSWILHPAPAMNEGNLRARIFRELVASYHQSKAVLAADREAVGGRTYVDPQYFPRFTKLAEPLAKSRLEDAVSFVSSVWYTAWIRAGKPAMPLGAAKYDGICRWRARRPVVSSNAESGLYDGKTLAVMNESEAAHSSPVDCCCRLYRHRGSNLSLGPAPSPATPIELWSAYGVAGQSDERLRGFP